MRHENEKEELAYWNCFFCHKPKFNGLYRVKNQYGQTADSKWNGTVWEGFTNPKFSKMLFVDPTIIYWKRKEEI